MAACLLTADPLEGTWQLESVRDGEGKTPQMRWRFTGNLEIEAGGKAAASPVTTDSTKQPANRPDVV